MLMTEVTNLLAVHSYNMNQQDALFTINLFQ